MATAKKSATAKAANKPKAATLKPSRALDLPDLEQRVSKVRTTIQTLSTQRSQLEGRLSSVQERAKADFGCSSLEEVRRKKDELILERDTLQVEVEEGLAQLEQELGDIADEDGGDDDAD